MGHCSFQESGEKEREGDEEEERAATFLGLRCYKVVFHSIHRVVLSWEESALKENFIPRKLTLRQVLCVGGSK